LNVEQTPLGRLTEDKRSLGRLGDLRKKILASIHNNNRDGQSLRVQIFVGDALGLPGKGQPVGRTVEQENFVGVV
jgi:hypothetical protein